MKEVGTAALTKAAGIANPIKTGMMKSQEAGGTIPKEKAAGRVMQIKMMRTKTRKTKVETMTMRTRVEMMTSKTKVKMMNKTSNGAMSAGETLRVNSKDAKISVSNQKGRNVKLQEETSGTSVGMLMKKVTGNLDLTKRKNRLAAEASKKAVEASKKEARASKSSAKTTKKAVSKKRTMEKRLTKVRMLTRAIKLTIRIMMSKTKEITRLIPIVSPQTPLENA